MNWESRATDRLQAFRDQVHVSGFSLSSQTTITHVDTGLYFMVQHGFMVFRVTLSLVFG